MIAVAWHIGDEAPVPDGGVALCDGEEVFLSALAPMIEDEVLMMGAKGR